jgi:Asp-tRNA(Asn)/Glu-tRNA(Gln) amidotransferase A subunit family amidase
MAGQSVMTAGGIAEGAIVLNCRHRRHPGECCLCESGSYKRQLAAEAADKAIRAGHAIGPLHGIPIAIRDLVEIEGEVAMGGTAAWR